MGEIAMNKAAFKAEFSKALSLLPPLGDTSLAHEDGLRRVRAVRGMQQVIVHYAARLPNDVAVPMLLEYGDILMARAEYRLCLDSIYSYLESLKLLSEDFFALSMTPIDRISYQVQSVFGLCVCGSSFLLRDDPQMRHPNTRRDLLDILGRLKAGVSLALPEQSLYWLAFNGTTHIFRLGTTLVTLGFAEEALEFLVFAALAMETHVEYSLPKYLRWRVQLAAAVCNAYLDLGARQRADAFVNRVVGKVEAIEALFKLDPVPMTVEQVSAFAACYTSLRMLRFKCAGEAADSDDKVKRELQGGFSADHERLLALAEALQSSKRRTVAHQPPTDGEARLLAAASEILEPNFRTVRRVLEGRRAIRERKEADRKEAESNGMTLEELYAERERVEADMAAIRSAEEEAKKAEEEAAARKAAKSKKTPDKGTKKAASKKGIAAAEPEEEPEEDPSKYVETHEEAAAFNAAVEDMPISTICKLTQAAFNYEEWNLFQKLLQTTRLRTSQDGDAPDRLDIAAVAEILGALRRLETNPGDTSLRGLVATIRKWYDFTAHLTPDLLTDTALMLWKQARDIIEGAEALEDQDSETAEIIMMCVHEVFEGVGVDDTTLRLVVALRLANLLDRRRAIHDAARVMREAHEAAVRGRYALLTKTRGAKDETVRWISASASQPTPEAEQYTKGMEENEQVLACLHTDVMMRLFRLELSIGLERQDHRVQRRVTKVTKEIEQAEGNASIFGTRTTATVRKDNIRLRRAGEQTTNPVQMERELLARVDKNPYERALLLMVAAPLHEERHQQERMLKEAAEALQAAQRYEDALFRMSAKKDKERRNGPPVPKIYCRSPTTVTLAAPRLHLNSNRKPESYYVYGKSFGVGVTMSINATAMEYEGLGKPLAVGERVTIEGLKPNDTYIFAIAAHDSKDRLIGELGECTPEIPMVLPMPLYLCWAYLANAATRLGCAPVAHMAASTVMDHFLVRTPQRPLWEAHPGDAESLHRAHADKAAWPLLRAVVHVMFLWVSKLAAPALEMPPKDQKTPYLEDQVTRIRAARRLGIAMQIASMLGDAGLMMEGAIRMNNLVAPLLALSDKSPMLVKTLASCHMVVQGVARDISLRQSTTAQMQYTAARATSAMTYQLVGLTSRHAEPRIERAAAAYFAKLECELLKALDSSLNKNRPDMQKVKELVDLQDVLLRHEALESFAPEGGALATRRATNGDVRAVMLPIINTMEAPGAWAKLQEFKESLEYTEMAAMLLEQAAAAGEPLENIQAWGLEALANVKTQAAVPRDSVKFRKWSLEKAAAEVEVAPKEVTLSEEDEGRMRQMVYGGKDLPEDMTEQQKAQLESSLAEARERRVGELAREVQRRVAAATLLQERVLPIIRYRKQLAVSRRLLGTSNLWRSRIAALLGVMIGSKARADKAERLEKEALKEKLEALKGSAPEVPAEETVRPNSSLKNQKAPPKGNSGAKNAGEVPAEDAKPPVPDEVLSLHYLARAAELAARAENWHQLQNVARMVWNVGRPLLNSNPELVADAKKAKWVQREVEVEPEPEPKGVKDKKGAKGGKKAVSPKKPGSPGRPGSKGKKDTATAPGDEGTKTKLFWMQEGGELSVARCLRGILVRCNELVAMVRSGRLLHSKMVPEDAMLERDAKSGLTFQIHGRRPSTATPLGSESNFSLGSDRAPVQWFNMQDDVDIVFYGKLANMCFNVFKQATRWNAIFKLAEEFNRISDDAFAETIIPFQMLAAPMVGTDISVLHVALEKVVRDKKQALEELHRVRNYVRDRLATVPFLQTSPTRKAKKKAGSQFKGNAGRLRALEQVSTSSRTAGRPEGSIMTGVTSRTAKTKATSRPENIVVPEQYAKVIETLKERQEKVWQVQAMNELGDVHAHFGNWAEATQIWNDALDTIVGPYQVIKSWRTCLGELTPSGMLNKYGLQWILMSGGVLLGKLVRYGYPHQIGTQLEAARMAAELLCCIFSASATHPQRRVGFSCYTPMELWHTVNPFHDPYATPLEDLLSGCDAIASCLLDNGIALQALPVLALYEHLALHCARCVDDTVHCRQMRVQACVKLGLMADAHRILIGLMAGKGLPDASSESDLVVKSAAGAPVRVDPPSKPFDPRLPPSHPDNQPSIGFVISTSLPRPLGELYGKYQACRIMMRRAQWLTAIGAHPNFWKATSPQTGKEVQEPEKQDPVEHRCLEEAATILESVVALSREDFDAEKKARLLARPVPEKTTEKKRGKKDDKSGKAAKGKGGKGAKEVSVDDDQPAAIEAPADGYIMTSEDHEANIQAQLLLAEVRELQWRDRAAILLLQAAMGYIAKHAQEVRNNAGSNTATERTLFGPRLWMRCRKDVCRLYLNLGHTKLVHQLVEDAQKEASQVKEVWMMLAIRGCGVAADVIEGSTSKSLSGYKALLATYDRLGLDSNTLEAAKTLLEYGSLLDRLGYRAASRDIDSKALAVLRHWTHEMGLHESKEHAELVNLYASGNSVLADALLRASTHEMRQMHFEAARNLAQEALATVPYGRASPHLHARAAALVARCQRHMLLPPPTVPIKLTVKEMSSARSALQRALAWLIRDGGQDLDLLRFVLGEASALLLANKELERANEMMQLVYRTSSRARTLRHATHTLEGVTVGSLPKWIVDVVNTRERFLVGGRGSALPADRQVPDAEIGRAAICELNSLRRRIGSWDVAERSSAQAIDLHNALKVACPSYAAQCCQASVPLVPGAPENEEAEGGGAAVSAPAKPVKEEKKGKKGDKGGSTGTHGAATGPPAPLGPGAVVVVWHEQDGCWQDNASWCGEGDLPLGGRDPSDEEVLTQERPAPVSVAMLYIVVPSDAALPLDEDDMREGAADFGDKAYPLKAVKDLQRRVKDLRIRAAEGSLEGQPLMSARSPPDAEELRELMRDLGSFLRQDVLEDEPGFSREQSGINATDGDAAGTAAASGGKEPAYLSAGLGTLPKIEALLNVDDGMCEVDEEFADWLRSVFHPN